MHTAITKAFKRYHLFGFTGTPIFADNAGTGGNPQLRTTEQAFGDRLHTYTIVDAINDKNVLPFRSTTSTRSSCRRTSTDKQVSAIDTERALLAPERIGQVVGYIREHFDQKTKRSFALHPRRASGSHGFNSLFATASIDAAKRYYAEFARQQAELPQAAAAQGRAHLLATPPTRTTDDDFLDEEEFETERPRRELARLPRGRDRGLQRDVRHELRHLVGQVPELLQGPLAAAEEPRDRPRRSSSTCS